ncbi:MAG: leucyl/phenylalanyl-tRNA--protein transferase, partial [Bacteroidales bacterium]|nr:leucyl/phenylalanyl-tRNA--protein transferase [Bacteroidales bacterium]
GTWILDEMIEAYCTLHKMGIAHSFETYLDGELVGGLYGVSIGKIFCGESMFHRVSDASKVAFYHLHQFLQVRGFKLIDCQQETNHLQSLGAYAIPRSEYLNILAELVKEPTLVGNWGNGDCEEYYINIKQTKDSQFWAYNLDEDEGIGD